MTSERGTRTTEALRGSTEATRSSGASLETRPGALDRLAGAARRMTEGVGFAASGPVDGAAFDKAGRSLTDLAVSRPDIPLPALARGLVARGEVDRGEPRIVAAAEADLDAAGLAPAADPISRTFLEIQAQGQGRPTPAAAAMRKALQEGRCDAVTAARGFEAKIGRASCRERVFPVV